MNRLKMIAVTGLVMVAGAAWGQVEELPLDQIWSMNAGAAITAVSSPWTEGEARYILIGAPNRVLIVGDGEIDWESEPQYRDIVAVERIETASEPILVIAQQYSGLGCLTKLTGQDHEPGGPVTFCRDGYNGWTQTHYGISTIYPYCTEPNDENSDRIFIGYWHEEYTSHNMHDNEYWGNCTCLYCFESHETPSENNSSGIPESVQRSGDGFVESAVGVCTSGGGSSDPNGSNSWQSTYLWSFGTSFENSQSYRLNDVIAPSAMCLRADNDEQFCVIESQGAQNRLTIYALPGIEKIHDSAVPDGHIIKIVDTGWNMYASSCLLLFYQDGRVLAVDTEGRSIGERIYQLPQPPKLVYWGQFDRDTDLELLVVVDSSLTLFDLAPLGISGNSTPSPCILLLEPAYPNPFNSTTRIDYSTSGDAYPTRLMVFDPMGRRVADLIPAVYPPFNSPPASGGGKYSVVWDASGVPAGSYVIKLDAGGKSQSSRVELVK